MEPIEGKYLKIDEVAAHLGVHRSTIYRWLSEKRLPAPIYLGPKSPRFCSTELLEKIQSTRI